MLTGIDNKVILFSIHLLSERLWVYLKVVTGNGTFHLPEGEAMVGSKLRTIRNKT